MRGGAPTIQDVARIAGVSTATVSRALSLPDRVSVTTREKIATAIRETGYVVNQSARNLRRQQTGTIVVLVPNIGNSFFSNILEGIETICAESDVNVLLADTRKPSMSRLKLQTYFSTGSVDGIIILDGSISVDAMVSLHRDIPPMVYAGEWIDDIAVPMILVDNRLGAELAVRHLLELGHQHLGHVTGLLTHNPGRLRLEGFRSGLLEHGLDPDQAWIFEGDYSLEAGDQAAKVWLQMKSPPSAVFCAGDAIAFGFMATLHKAGISFPEDLSVVGFDDIEVARYYIPALTTIHQPRRALGESAARLLLNLIGNNRLDTRPANLDPWLVVRDSTAPPRAR